LNRERVPEKIEEVNNKNPFDVNLQDSKEAIILKASAMRFNFTETIPY